MKRIIPNILNNYLHYFLVVILSIICILLAQKVRNHHSKTSIQDFISINENRNKEIESDISNAYLESAAFLTNGLDGGTNIISQNHDTIRMAKILNGRVQICLFISKANCDLCVIQELDNLRCFVKEHGSDNVFIVADFKSIRELSVLLKMNKVDCSHYIFYDNKRPWAFTSINVPKVVVISRNGLILSLFLTIKNLPEMTSKYYSKIDNWISGYAEESN